MVSFKYIIKEPFVSVDVINAPTRQLVYELLASFALGGVSCVTGDAGLKNEGV